MTVSPRTVMVFVVGFVAAALITYCVETERACGVPAVDEVVEQVNAAIEQTDVPVEQQTIEQRLDWLFGDVAPFRRFFAEFQSAVSNDDPQMVADFIAFPLYEGDKQLARNRPQFIERYSSIFRQSVRDAVLNQSWAGLFAKADGIMFGNGEVWAAPACPKHPDGGCSGRDQMLVLALEAINSGDTNADLPMDLRLGRAGRGCSNMVVRVMAINQEGEDVFDDGAHVRMTGAVRRERVVDSGAGIETNGTIWVLDLDVPFTLRSAIEDEAPPVFTTNITSVQLVLTEAQYQRHSNVVDYPAHVVVRGSVFPGNTAHHFTPALIQVDGIEIVPTIKTGK